MHNICFSTFSFRDSKSVAAENINGIEGRGLAQAFADHLQSTGWTCEDIFAEDYGWAFSARKDEICYFLTTSVDPDSEGDDLEPDDYPPVGMKMFVNVNIHRERSFWQKLTGANKQTLDDPVTHLIENWIKAQDDVQNFEVHK